MVKVVLPRSSAYTSTTEASVLPPGDASVAPLRYEVSKRSCQPFGGTGLVWGSWYSLASFGWYDRVMTAPSTPVMVDR